MIEEEIVLNDFECVCRDNYRQVRDNKICYIYIDSVLKRTIELCETNDIKYKTQTYEDYYSIEGYDNTKRKRGKYKNAKENKL